MGSIVDIKTWLGSYQGLQFEYDTWDERRARLTEEQYIPAMRESDGSKHSPGASDRMANATLRRIEFEQRTAEQIRTVKDSMAAIEDAIASLKDPMQRGVLTQRYITGNGHYGLRPWADIALMLYHRCDEVGLKRVRRIYNAALKELERREVEKREESDL